MFHCRKIPLMSGVRFPWTSLLRSTSHGQHLIHSAYRIIAAFRRKSVVLFNYFVRYLIDVISMAGFNFAGPCIVALALLQVQWCMVVHFQQSMGEEPPHMCLIVYMMICAVRMAHVLIHHCFQWPDFFNPLRHRAFFAGLVVSILGQSKSNQTLSGLSYGGFPKWGGCTPKSSNLMGFSI